MHIIILILTVINDYYNYNYNYDHYRHYFQQFNTV